MATPPYMPLYVGDYLGDTTQLNCVEHGAYLLLLMAMWRADGRLPDDDRRLAATARCTAPQWTRIRPTLIGYFRIEDGQLAHDRLERELDRYRKGVEQKRQAGIRSAAAKSLKRRGCGPTDVGSPLQQPKPEPEPDSPSVRTDGGRRRAGARRLPPDWRPSTLDLEAAAGLGFEGQALERQLSMMRDHEFARPLTDWSAALRNWLRRAQSFEASHEKTPDPQAEGGKLARRQDNLSRCMQGFERLAGHGRSG